MNNKIIEKTLKYIGYENPDSPMAVEFEILGLRTAILKAEEKIASLEQSKALAKLELERIKKKDA